MIHSFNYEDVKQSILESGDRDRVIAWLKWNDPNGIYSDNDCDNEWLPRLDLKEAIELMTSQLQGGE